jgi:hypothetical protein
VITIIVLLLALLTPALDKAIYQAELAVCGGKLKAIASSVTAYTFDYRKWYPFRDLPPTRPGVGNPEFVSPFQLYRPVNTFDMRPPLRGIMDIDRMLQCPMTDDDLDLDHDRPEDLTLSSYAMWWGWYYQLGVDPPQGSGALKYRGLFRLGDRFEWERDTYNLLVGDWDLYQASAGAQASHPDDRNVLTLFTSRAELSGGIAERGMLDLNYAMTDNSVARFNGVEPYLNAGEHDPRMGAVPMTWRNMEPAKRFQIPR